MKLWIKFLIGALIGIGCAFILPLGNAGVENGMRFAAEIAVRFGRYMAAPVVFFFCKNAIKKKTGKPNFLQKNKRKISVLRV